MRTDQGVRLLVMADQEGMYVSAAGGGGEGGSPERQPAQGILNTGTNPFPPGCDEVNAVRARRWY